MRNVHPEEILKMELIDGRKLSVSNIAYLLNITCLDILSILEAKMRISKEVTLRLKTFFGGKANLFLRLQTAYDLQEAKNI